MNRPAGALVGGAAGTTVMSGLMVLLDVQTRDPVPIFEVIARFVWLPERVILGFVVFAFAGTVIWPLLFVALEEYIPRGPDPAARGVVFASVIWLVFVVTGRGDLDGGILVIYAGYTLFAHWAYGFTLGAVYARLNDRPADWRRRRMGADETT